MWRKLFCAFALLTAVTLARAAEIGFLNIPGDVGFISIKGEITAGDGDRFYDLIEGHDRISVMLQSPGGLVKEALQIYPDVVPVQASVHSGSSQVHWFELWTVLLRPRSVARD